MGCSPQARLGRSTHFELPYPRYTDAEVEAALRRYGSASPNWKSNGKAGTDRNPGPELLRHEAFIPNLVKPSALHSSLPTP